MKKSALLLSLLVLFSQFGFAQLSPDDLIISGYVTDVNGAALSGQYVCVYNTVTDPMQLDSICANTNSNGWYSIVIENGSVTGPNQTYGVYVMESCNNVQAYHTDEVSNGQGTIDTATVSFQFACGSNTGGGCNCEADIITSINPSDSTYFFAVDVPCGTAPFQYQWWIDGIVSADATPSHQFFQDGIYGVGVTVADANGCSFTAWDTLFVGNTSCTAYWYYNSSPNSTIPVGVPNAFHFSGSAPNTAYFQWTVNGMGLSMTSEDMNPSFTFPTAGTYNVCLTVIDSITMCSADFCANVTASGSNTGGCQAYFETVDSSGYSYFLNYTQGNPTGFSWDFGDGNTSNQTHPWHQYSQDGTYVVCLTVTGQNCQDSYCDTVVINTASTDSCSAYFSSSGPTPVGYTFSASIQSNLYNYTWTIDNELAQNSGTELYVPGFTEGTHTVCLTMSSGTCTDTYCETFVVGQDSTCEGLITGQVFAGTLNQPVDVAIVYLISYDDQTGLLAAMQATVVDSLGFYYFQNVPCGDYLVKAATTANSGFHSGYLPTYYGNSLFWEYAQEISVNEVMPSVQYDIVLIAGNNPGGPGFIGGNVLDGANKMEADGEPLEGVNVMLFDLTGNAVAYTYSDANGEFAFDGLAYGSYQVYAELLNHTTVPAVVTLSADEPMADELNIFVSENLISTGVAEVDFEAAVSEVYPNPVHDVATIAIDLQEACEVVVQVVDLTGRVIMTQSANIAPGVNSYRLPLNGVVDGNYMLSMREVKGAFHISRRFIVIR